MADGERHIRVQRTARYHVLGDPSTAQEIWFVLHGHGYLARYFLHSFEGLEEDRCIVAPEALSRYYLDTTFSRVGATWMTREDREHEIEDQIAYLDALALKMREECGRARRFCALGFSQGVATLCRWAVHGNTRLDRMVIWGGSMPPELDADVLRDRWSSLRIDLVHGEQDPMVKKDVLERNESILRTAALAFRSHTFAGGHTLDRLMLERLFSSEA
ncbi:MAG: hypothetical protein ABI599_05770 [Flavobacteriales bacterium]